MGPTHEFEPDGALVHVWLFGDEHYRASARDLAMRIATELGVE